MILGVKFRGMGSALAADELGSRFHDRSQLFTLQKGHPNVYAPGKRLFRRWSPAFPRAPESLGWTFVPSAMLRTDAPSV